jgi:hypothetical protein
MRHGPDGQTLDVGRRTRTIPPGIRRALLHRDKTCRFPGCHLRFGQGHHLRHWANGGSTSLDNLAFLCRRHHRAVHEEGFQVDRGADGELYFRRPDGRPLPEVPTPPLVARDPVGAVRARNAAAGVWPDARTVRPDWGGEPLDVGYALDVLRPQAEPCVASSPQEPRAEPPTRPASPSSDDDQPDGFLSAVARPCWR